MKTKNIEKWLLLEQSGELSPRRKKMLNACPEADEKRRKLHALCAAVSHTEVEEPSPWAATRIHARLQAERRSILLSARVWKPVLALAACLTVVVSRLDFTPESSPAAVASVEVGVADVWNVQFEEDLADLENLILAMSGDPLDIMEM